MLLQPLLLLLHATHVVSFSMPENCSANAPARGCAAQPGAARRERARGWRRVARFLRHPILAQSLASMVVVERQVDDDI